MSKLFVRITSGLVYVILFVGAILYSQKSFIVLTSVFAAISIWEFSKLIQFRTLVTYLFFVAMLFLLYMYPEDIFIKIMLAFTLICSLQLIYQLYVLKTSYPTKKTYVKVDLSIRYIVFSFGFLILFPFLNGEYNPILLISILVIIWVNDSFAFLVGKNFGKRKLFESISPKKTVEGFIGGLVFSMIAGYIIAINTELFSIVNWLIISVITSIIGTVGDLVESKFKRQANVKDSGKIMPGHGGLLDRLDSLLLAIPFVYLYIHYII